MYVNNTARLSTDLAGATPFFPTNGEYIVVALRDISKLPRTSLYMYSGYFLAQ